MPFATKLFASAVANNIVFGSGNSSASKTRQYTFKSDLCNHLHQINCFKTYFKVFE